MQPADPNLTSSRVCLSGFRTPAVTLSLTLGLLAAGAGYGRLRFGSVSATLDSLRGRSVLVDERAKSIIGVRPGSQVVMSYALTNISDRPVRIIGSSSSCECTTIEEMPITLPPSETRTVSARITISEHNPNSSGTLRLFTDEPRSPEIALSYTVRADHSLAAKVGPGQ